MAQPHKKAHHGVWIALPANRSQSCWRCLLNPLWLEQKKLSFLPRLPYFGVFSEWISNHLTIVAGGRVHIQNFGSCSHSFSFHPPPQSTRPHPPSPVAPLHWQQRDQHPRCMRRGHSVASRQQPWNHRSSSRNVGVGSNHGMIDDDRMIFSGCFNGTSMG